MRHQRRKGKLGVNHEHRKALLRNLVRNLVIQKRIKTTIAKAKAASALTDRMVTIAKRGDLHAQRTLISKLGCADTARALIKEIAPLFKERNGGYTRVLRLGTRSGDAAEIALLEFTAIVEAPAKPKKAKKAKKSKADSSAGTSQATKKPSSSTEEEKSSAGEKKAKDEDRKESEKKGGFLGTLRKFLKGDENK